MACYFFDDSYYIILVINSLVYVVSVLGSIEFLSSLRL